MSTLVIWASPNKSGLTAAAKDHIVEGLREGGETANEIAMHDISIERCRICGNGWGTCWDYGSCVIEDDFAVLYKDITNAEKIVFVAPVYWHDLPEDLKSFIDRLRRIDAMKNHVLEGKKYIIVACAGGSGNGAITALQRFEYSLNHLGMVACDRLPVTQFNREYMLPALKEAGVRFASED